MRAALQARTHDAARRGFYRALGRPAAVPAIAASGDGMERIAHGH
ncbi:hypothetical protein [Paraburkholderia sp. SOS3]|jgi:hypothetical protein|nr:hypothetical protein [Paraburkholderia sp. SOS3]